MHLQANISSNTCIYVKLSYKRRKPLWVIIENCYKKMFNTICYRPLRGDWSPWNKWSVTDKCPIQVCNKRIAKILTRRRRCNQPKPIEINNVVNYSSNSQFISQESVLNCFGESIQYKYSAIEEYSQLGSLKIISYTYIVVGFVNGFLLCILILPIIIALKFSKNVIKIQNIASSCVNSFYSINSQQYFGGSFIPEDKDSFILNNSRNDIS